MTLRLYNTLARTVQDLTPLDPPTVKMYVCGPTVYDEPHVGHVRSAYIFEILRRYLEYRKFQVKFVRNVTDVDDKIIQKAHETGEASTAVAERYLKRYHETLDRLGLRPPTHEPRATEHVVPEMTDLISKLLMQGAAYEAGGDVYFAVRKFPRYGQLSNRSLDELQAGTRVESGEHKRDPLDFALWKAAKPGEPSWNSPWGKGRPGWHIECSAMSTKYLDDEFDIHGGGVDLVFPHHENEIAQAQAAGKPFARYWMHHGLLTVHGEKMSKSLGNFITVEQVLEQCHGDVNVLKVFFLGAHYRSPVDYNAETLKAASGRWNRWYYFLFPAETQRSSALLPEKIPSEISRLTDEFERSMDEDLGTPAALAVFDQLVNVGNAWWKELESPSGKDQDTVRLLRGNIVKVADTLRQLGEIFGLSWRPLPQLSGEEVGLINRREAARKRKDFQEADAIRRQLEKKGLIVEDTEQGPVIVPKR